MGVIEDKFIQPKGLWGWVVDDPGDRKENLASVTLPNVFVFSRQIVNETMYLSETLYQRMSLIFDNINIGYSLYSEPIELYRTAMKHDYVPFCKFVCVFTIHLTLNLVLCSQCTVIHVDSLQEPS